MSWFGYDQVRNSTLFDLFPLLTQAGSIFWRFNLQGLQVLVSRDQKSKHFWYHFELFCGKVGIY